VAQSASGLPTLGAVARVAGVSISTVSKVLNGRSDVSPSTRTRVSELLSRAGYCVVRGQNTRRRGSGRLVEVVANRLDGALTSRLLRVVCLEAYHRRVGVVVTDVEPEGGRAGRCPPARWLDALSYRGADAVISLLLEFSETQRAYFEAHAIAACMLEAGLRGGECAVRVDERARGRDAVRHLLELGHTRVAVVAGPARTPVQTRLAEGCREALRAAGVRTAAEYVVHAPLTADNARRATRELLALDTPPTAIAFASEQTAFGGCAAISALGLRVPRDVSVICCDGPPDGSMVTPGPPLTTLTRPLGELARAAMDLVSGERQAAGVFNVPPKLVVRGSTAAPRRPDQCRR